VLHHLPELVPEEEAEDGVGTQAEVDGAEALVEAQRPLFAGDLQDAVHKPPVELALGGERGAGCAPLPDASPGKSRLRPPLTAPSASTGWL